MSNKVFRSALDSVLFVAFECDTSRMALPVVSYCYTCGVISESEAVFLRRALSVLAY